MSVTPLLSLDDVLPTSHGPGCTLRVPPGAPVALFGTDARLLSRLLDMVAGHATPLRGRIVLDGDDITHRRPEDRPIGLVSARDPLFDHLNVRANVAFPLRARRAAPSDIAATTARTLALTGLDALAEKSPRDLSPEEAFRVRLARVLAYAPRLLLFDNPLEKLNGAAARRIVTLLATLGRALKLTMVCAVTQRAEALRLGDRIAVMDAATVLQCDRAATLLDRPEDDRVALLFGEANVLPGRVLDVTDDIAEIRLANGAHVEAIATDGLENDALCTVCIRPDRIAPHFGTTILGGDDEHPLIGTVQDITHLGDHMRFKLRLEDGAEIELRRPPMQNLRGVAIGTRAQLAWPAGQATAFPLREDSY